MKVLFEDGDWRLITSGLSTMMGGSDIQHRCREKISSGLPQEWWYYCGSVVCGVCEEPIPDELRGLKRLQDWER